MFIHKMGALKHFGAFLNIFAKKGKGFLNEGCNNYFIDIAQDLNCYNKV